MKSALKGLKVKSVLAERMVPRVTLEFKDRLVLTEPRARTAKTVPLVLMAGV